MLGSEIMPASFPALHDTNGGFGDIPLDGIVADSHTRRKSDLAL
jgi:hypothetical protein